MLTASEGRTGLLTRVLRFGRELGGSPVSVLPHKDRALRFFLAGTVCLSVAVACLENGLHPLALLCLPIIALALARQRYDKPYLLSEKVTAAVLVVYAVLVLVAIIITVRRVPFPLLTVYFTFGTILARALSRLTDRHVAQLLFLSVGMVLINCILTNQLLFGMLLPVYLFFLMASMALFNVARSRGQQQAPSDDVPDEKPGLLWRYFARIALVIFLATAVVFVALPRPFLSMPGLRDAMSKPGGLAELEQRVSYRDMVDMAGSQRIAFAANIIEGTLPDYPYWRGRVLSSTDGKGWFAASGERAGMPRSFRPEPDELVVYEFVPYKLQSKTVYAAGLPIGAKGAMNRRLHITTEGEVVIDSPFLFSHRYEVDVLKRPVPAHYTEIKPNLGTEGITPRVAALAREWASSANTPQEKANALIERFRQRFEYTLRTPPRPEGANPLEFFLFESRAGHCEYFAGAYCLMLRSLGIPARVVEGFAGMEPGDEPNQVIVRFGSAHAWVEAMLDRTSWTLLDPTPPARDPAAGRFWRRLMDFYDRLEHRWTKSVVYFDRSDQAKILAALGSLASGEILLPESLADIADYLGWIVVSGLVILTVVVLLIRRTMRGRGDLEALYLETMRKLADKGILTRAHTWHEDNLLDVEQTAPAAREPLSRFTEAYFRVRFGPGDQSRTRELSEARRELMKCRNVNADHKEDSHKPAA